MQTLLLHGSNSHRTNDAERFVVQDHGVVNGGEFDGARCAVNTEALSHDGIHDSGYLCRARRAEGKCCHATFLRGFREILYLTGCAGATGAGV